MELLSKVASNASCIFAEEEESITLKQVEKVISHIVEIAALSCMYLL
jgi:hypothetical protein